jgi:hypothetical protein
MKKFMLFFGTVQNMEKNYLEIHDSSQILFAGPGSGQISRYSMKKFMLLLEQFKIVSLEKLHEKKIDDCSQIIFAGPGSGQILRYRMKMFMLFLGQFKI